MMPGWEKVMIRRNRWRERCGETIIYDVGADENKQDESITDSKVSEHKRQKNDKRHDIYKYTKM